MIKVTIDNKEYGLSIEMLLGSGPKKLTEEDIKNIHKDTIDYVVKTLPVTFISIKRMMVMYKTTRLAVDVLMKSTLSYSEGYPKPIIEFNFSVDTDVQANKWFDKPGYEDESDFAVKVIHALGTLTSIGKTKEVQRKDPRSRVVH